MEKESVLHIHNGGRHTPSVSCNGSVSFTPAGSSAMIEFASVIAAGFRLIAQADKDNRLRERLSKKDAETRCCFT
ncbi:MAG: hypothetical protein JST39_19680 [Bacteroidetes bacterium]|nr:hypothetical protein [Bacteroidota bacterium]